MLTTLSGTYRNGQVELDSPPADLPAESKVLVTFLACGPVDLAARGIDADDAAGLRARLASFADEWSSAEMAQYDDYDAHRQRLEAR